MPDDNPFARFNLPSAGRFTNLPTGTFSGFRPDLAELALQPGFGIPAAPVAVDQPRVPPELLRGGQKIPRVELDPSQIGAIFTPPKPLDLPRVLAQTPAAGTPLPRGSRVDLVVSAARDVPFDLFLTPHKGFKGKTIGDFEGVLDDEATRNVLLVHESATTLPPADRERVLGVLRQKNVAVDENDPQATFERAFQTLRGAAAFR